MGLRAIDIRDEYRTNNSSIGSDFLIPSLNQSIVYKRAVGFFSSSALIELSKGIGKLAKNGGKIQIIVSPRLSEEDIEAMHKGYRDRYLIVQNRLLSDFTETIDLDGLERLNLLSYLISEGIMDIKVAFLNNQIQIGMYHEKIGVLIDTNGDSVGFTGSLNESQNSLQNNFESIMVFKSWIEPNRVKKININFDNLWNNNTDKIEIIDFPHVVREKLSSFRTSTPPFIIEEPIDSTPNDFKVKPCLNIDLYDYQKQAVNEWFKNKCQGIFDMATGTGKTYTAYAAMIKLLERKKYKLAIIVVCPLQHLVDQWEDDAVEFNFQPIIGYSGTRHSGYKTELTSAVMNYNSGLTDFFLFITTNASYVTDSVQEILSKIKGDVLFIADEAHNLGAEKLKNKLNDKYKYRLALSATIDRYMDDIGTESIKLYFGKKCIEYSLELAIKEHKLVPYYYYPLVVNLTPDEREEYVKLTVSLGSQMHKGTDGKMKLSKSGELIALKRARIIAGANNKLTVLKREITPYKNDYHTLVYCGTAKTGDAVEEIRQIDFITNMLGNDLDMKIGRYTSLETSLERKELKKRFQNGEDLQALIAIKCLDEGVNIPSIKNAFILASSTNPREYVQRRGRVLRTAEGKKHSMIYDFITIPISFEDAKYFSKEELKYFATLLKNEINRMKEFSSVALNPSESDVLISKIYKSFQMGIIQYDDIESIEWSQEHE
jgi:superfamily II DNA or RNA helicase